MQKFEEPVQNLRGDTIALAPMLVFLAGTETTATIYFDAAGQNPITDPRTDRTGVFAFYAANGRYDVYAIINGVRIGHKLDLLMYDPADAGGNAVTGTAFAALSGSVQTLADAVQTTSEALDAVNVQATTTRTLIGWQRPSAFDLMPTDQVADVQAGTAAIDVAATLQAAIDATSGILRLPRGTYRLGAQIIVRGTCTGLVGEGRYDTVLDKRFNGNPVSCLTNGATLAGFGITGNGATYTGGGILPEGYNTVLSELRINDTQDSAILVKGATGSNANAATYLTVDDCFLNPTTPSTTMSIRSIGADDAGRPTCRTFNKLSGGSSLVDFSGMNYATLSDSLGTAVKFSSTSGKIHMSNNRLTCQDDITIYGIDHVIKANSWGFGAGKALILDASAANVTFDAANAISINGIFGQPIRMPSAVGNGNPNFIHSEGFAYPFGWYATTTNPVLGNGTSQAHCKLSGSMCFVSMSMTTGSTTSVGTGVYTFQLPYKALYTATCPVLIHTAAGTYYEASFIVQSGGAVGIVVLSDAATAAWGSTTLAFGAGSTFDMSLNYEISPS